METMELDVCSSVCSASEGGLGAYAARSDRWAEGDAGEKRTPAVPALGGLITPAVMALQMSPTGSSSFQGTVNSGESHRTMDDGSSNR